MSLGLWLPLLFAAGSGHAWAQTSADTEYQFPSLSEKIDPARYAQFGKPWREHLLKVRDAMSIQDPLQRCLAWPDPPGNQWPAGHAASHCRNHFDTTIPSLDLDWLEENLQRGDLAAIDAGLDGLLARHFQPEPQFNEAIHYFFEKIGADARSDVLTSRWLRAAPEDAYALLARASYYKSAAWQARGGQFASETASGKLERMSELAERAIPLYRKAIAKNPRLMPAYEGLLNIGTVDSENSVAEEALKGARAIDPACNLVASEILRALKPRWGGSYEAMEAYVDQTKTHMASRPLIAMYLGSPFDDIADVVSREKTPEAKRLAAELSDKAVAVGSNENALERAASNVNLAYQLENLPDGGEGKSLAYAMQAERFRPLSPWLLRWMAQVFVRRDPSLGLRYADAAYKEKPEDAVNQFMLAATLYNTRQYKPADHYYRLAMESRDLRLPALREVTEMWLAAKEISNELAVARSTPYLATLEQEYPKEGRAGFLRLVLEHRRNGRVELDNMRKALAGHDASDEWQAERAAQLRETLKAAP